MTILLFSTNSDLFGRRPFLLISNAVNLVAYALMATAKSSNQFLAGVVLNGCGSGTAGVALIACPELLPNKFRHIGVVLADAFVLIMIPIGPVAARTALNAGGDTWKFIYWAGFVISTIAFVGLAFLYCKSSQERYKNFEVC